VTGATVANPGSRGGCGRRTRGCWSWPGSRRPRLARRRPRISRHRRGWRMTGRRRRPRWRSMRRCSSPVLMCLRPAREPRSSPNRRLSPLGV